MKLIYAPTSPFVRKVMVLLHETDQLDDVDIQSVATTPLATADEVKSANPLGKIPALQRDDGPTLYDSRVICAYLDDRAKSGLYAGGWDSRVLEATADGIMDAAVSATYERRMRPEEKQWDDWETAQLGKVVGGCAALNARWMSHLKGPFDIGHIAVGCALGYVDFRHPDSNWRQGNEALADWFKGFESRPSMLATQPPAG
ncbi:glutathione S-transferase [Parasedimentitalea maritima]|uniref:Glutathione S-transferase n=1 Tax=Parasedimentitalea maritima TaxID=2578117 RepID=A0A5R8ZIZ8_9RHOB|nr:glutathione S-transferase [Zongyanglinia marina]KAE9630971.1 glutathione S-transferase [Zongyanglinia marina]TLP65752.1 glutathione S-transferase [Zongyanglinia marina]